MVLAGVQVWMITGDKQETAINIAIACKLVHHPDSLIVINAADSNEAARARLDEALQHCRERHAASVGLPSTFQPERRGMYSGRQSEDWAPTDQFLPNCSSSRKAMRWSSL